MQRGISPQRRPIPTTILDWTEPVAHDIDQIRHWVALLLHGVSITNGHGTILERLVINRDRPWRADFILTPVPLAHVTYIVPCHRYPRLQCLVNLSRLFHDVRLVCHKREYGNLVRCEAWFEMEDCPAIARFRAGL